MSEKTHSESSSPSVDTWGVDGVSGSRQRLRRLVRPLESRYGVIFSWRHHRAANRSWESRGLAPSVLDAGRAGPPVEPDPATAPIFVLGATWRSGSTLLQRLLLSSGDVMMWGEPWNRCDLVQRLRESLRPLDDRWPLYGHVIDEIESDDPLEAMMVPDLFPTRADLIESHRALFDRLYGEPAAREGYRRWGFKETRLGADDARYLHLLYPDARIIMLYRDPYASWDSYLALRSTGHARWPDQPIVSPRAFGEMWRDRVRGFVDYPDDLPHMTVSYESLLADPQVVQDLAAFCGVEPNLATLERKVGRSHGVRSSSASARRIEGAVGALAAELGYGRPVG